MIVADIILPVFGLVTLGYIAGKAGWIGQPGIEGLSTFVFNFAVPVMLFRSIAIADLPEAMPWSFLVGYYGATIAVFGAMLVVGRILLLSLTESAIFAMSGAYANVVLLGIPLVIASLGDDAAVPLFIIVSTHAAIMFLMTTFFAETGRGDRKQLSSLPLQTASVLLRNTIVVGLLLGLIVNLSGLALPPTIDTMAGYLGGAALPCAVFSMGASISQYRIAGHITRIALVVAAKNLVHPLLVWALCDLILGLPALWTAVAVILAGCPSGINAYLFASRYQAIVAPTATVVVISTACSMPILTLLLTLLLG